MMVRNKQKLVVKSQHLFMLFFFCIALTVFADYPKRDVVNEMIAGYKAEAIPGDLVQDTSNVFKIAHDVSRIFTEALQTASFNDEGGDTNYLNALFTTNYASNEVAMAYKNDVNARIKSQKGDIGVDFRADYSENFKPGFSPDEDIYYKRRFYFGIEWNIIKGGFLESRAKANQLGQEYNLKDIDAKKSADAENYRSVFNYINFLFNKQKIEVLKERYMLIEQQLNFTTELYYLRYLGWEKVLHIRAKLEDLKQEIDQLENFNKYIPSSIPDSLLNSKYTAESLPLVDIDLNKLMQIYHNNATTDSIAAIKLAMYSDGMKWWQDVSLKPYLRYNLYVDPTNQQRRFAAGGVSLTVPLRFRNKANLVSAKEAIYRAEGKSEFQAGDNELVNHYAEFAFKLKQIKEFYYKKLFADELIRKELVKLDYEDIGFNPVYTLGLIDDKKSIEAEIIDIKKRLYIQLVQMAFYLDQKSPMAFVEVLNPRDFTSRYKTGIQIFVDEATSRNMDTRELLNYLWKNEIRDVILEVDSWDFNPKVNEILDQAARNHIYFTINRKQTEAQKYPDVNADLHQISQINNQYIDGLHYNMILNKNLNREVQDSEFSAWLDKIDPGQKTNNTQLGITISDDLSPDLLKKVFNKFDLVFILSDGAPDRAKFESRLAQEFAMGKEKLTLILNANDFADRLHMENYMKNLNSETGIANFAISNINNMIQADLRTFQMGENTSLESEEIIASIRNQIFADNQKNKKTIETQKEPVLDHVQTNKEPESVEINKQIQDDVQKASPKDAKAKTPEPFSVNFNKAQDWQIEIAVSKESLSNDYLKDTFKIDEDIRTYQVDGLNVYTFGSYENEDAARAALEEYKTQSQNKSAYVVSYE